MATILLLTAILALLSIIGIAFWKPILRTIRKHQDTKLRMWCIEQAAITQHSLLWAEHSYLFIRGEITYNKKISGTNVNEFTESPPGLEKQPSQCLSVQ